MVYNSIAGGLLQALKSGQRCQLCGDHCSTGDDFCTPCRHDLPWLPPGCYRCAIPLPDPDETLLCGNCLSEPPHFHRTEAAWLYQPPLAKLIADYKYHRKFYYGRSLALLLAERLLSAYREEPLPDVITSVPLHWRRRLRRGFNQSELVALEVGKCLALQYQPLLKRIRTTAQQQGLDAQQRSRNLRGAFTCCGPLRGKRVALVDDVMTTGSTANEISRTLLKAGASEVHLWCLARTPRH